MKLSIFPKANPHPKDKEEKRVESFKVSAPNLPETVTFETHEELIKLVTNNAWSPFIFSGPRHADNFVSTDLLVYDIDEGLTIDEAETIVKKKGFACLVLPSPSHTESCHRFRIIIPLAYTITSVDTFENTWKIGAEIFGNTVDNQCRDVARYFFGSTQEDGFWEVGELYEPVVPVIKEQTVGHSSKFDNANLLPVDGDISDKVKAIFGENRHYVSEAVDFFIRNAHTGLPGQWINSLNRFCFSLALSEVPEDVILAVCKELAPAELDKKDLYQIKRAIQDANKELN